MPHAIATHLLRPGAMSPAETAAVAFLARYQNPRTHELYRRYLGEWYEWCRIQGLDPLADVERVHVELYIRHLSLSRQMSSSTVNTAMTPVRGLYRLAASDGTIPRDPSAYARLPKIHHRSEAPFDRDDMRRFLRAAAETSPRHHALASLLSMMGLRISEACALDIPDVHRIEQGYRVLRFVRKGGREVVAPIPYQAIPILEAATVGRHTGPLLTTLDGTRRLTRHAGAGLVQTIAKRAGFDRRLHPHLLRKAAVTLILDSGGTLAEAQDFADHADPRTTQRHYDLNRSRLSGHGSHLVASRIAA
ncbi:tyrosine-type recombinase/integrase [Nocardioides sp.]|uniref:tyrosine-type recombinase/integrase n=1 Tax=Nocardioides sp. TaxID=35761 RepID=UPI0026357D38|nr:tyrosine-type recombinase/integrase [Nocardioides sp.]